MKEAILKQMGKELKLATRLDLVTVIVAVAVTLTLFPVAAIFAASSVGSITGSLSGGITGGLAGMVTKTFNTTPTIIMFVCLLTILTINWCAARMLISNKKQRAKVNEAMTKLYKDEGVDQYYDGSIFKSYETRYNLFAVIVAAVGALSIIVPLIVFIDQLTKL